MSSALISALTSSTTSTTSTSSALSSLDTSDFLELLLAELDNQDPTDPVKTSELTSMFASLTQVSAAETTNAYLSTLVDTMSSSQAVSYLGKTITYTGSDSTEATAVVSGIEYSDGVAYLVTEGGNTVKMSSVTGVS